jgi:hypothetical protein
LGGLWLFTPSGLSRRASIILILKEELKVFTFNSKCHGNKGKGAAWQLGREMGARGTQAMGGARGSIGADGGRG